MLFRCRVQGCRVTWCGTRPQLQPAQRAVCSRARQDHRHYHIVFRLDHSNQKSGRLVPQNLAAEPKSTPALADTGSRSGLATLTGMLASRACALRRWLAVIGRAASPSEKTARVNIIPQAQEEVKRTLRCARHARGPAPGAALLGQHARSVVSFPFTHLAREGRMTVTIGRRELLVAFGGAAAWPLAARRGPWG